MSGLATFVGGCVITPPVASLLKVTIEENCACSDAQDVRVKVSITLKTFRL
jgi:hypothetical protein